MQRLDNISEMALCVVFALADWMGYIWILCVYGYGSKLGTPKLWMVNTKLD